MPELLGRLALLALGVAASPISIVGILVILLTRRARLGSILFATSWVAGIVTALVVATAFTGRVSPPRQGLDLPFEGAIAIALGIGMMIAAVLAHRGRMKSDDPQQPPTWVQAVDDLSPTGGAVLAFANATTSPKNIALALAAGVVLRERTNDVSQLVFGGLFYVAIAAITVVTPVLVYLLNGRRAENKIAQWKAYVTARAAAVMELTVFGLGAVLTLKGLSNLIGSML